ncbi:MAG: restriction endonuclease subunit S [Anaerolineaceae bacterium]
MSSEEWKHLPLEDCMDAIIDYRGKTPRKSSFGIPLITAKIVKDGRILEPTEFIPCEDYDERMQRGIPKAGDVVITTEGPLGEVGQLDNRKLSVGQRIITLRGKTDLLDNTYLKYHLMSTHVQEQLLSRETGTTVTGIKQSELRKVKLKVPPLPTQHRIAEILSSLDDKIELNRQTNATLEAIAQAIFKEWFVDFNYPGATGERVDSKFGPIPKGWKVSNLGNEGEFKNGINYSRDEPGDYAFSIVNVRNIVGNRFVILSDLDKVNIDTKKAAPYKLSIQDIIIARSASPGVAAILYEPTNDTIFSGFTIRYRINLIENVMFIFLLFQSMKEKLADLANGTTLKSINQVSLKSVQIVIPEKETLEEFSAIVRSIYDKIFRNQLESELLSHIRDLLLPELMSNGLKLR